MQNSNESTITFGSQQCLVKRSRQNIGFDGQKQVCFLIGHTVSINAGDMQGYFSDKLKCTFCSAHSDPIILCLCDKRTCVPCLSTKIKDNKMVIQCPDPYCNKTSGFTTQYVNPLTDEQRKIMDGYKTVIDIIENNDNGTLPEAKPVLQHGSFNPDEYGFLNSPISFHHKDPRMLKCICSFYMSLSCKNRKDLSYSFYFSEKECSNSMAVVSELMRKEVTFQQVKEKGYDIKLNSLSKETRPSKFQKGQEYSREKLHNIYDDEGIKNIIDETFKLIFSSRTDSSLLFMAHRFFNEKSSVNIPIIEKARSLPTSINKTADTKELLDNIKDVIDTDLVPFEFLFEVLCETASFGILNKVERFIGSLDNN